jgi:hypothetical protein
MFVHTIVFKTFSRTIIKLSTHTKMSETRVRPFVLTAVHQAMNAHEIEPFSFYDALHAAERMYCVNWRRFRERKGLWTQADETRAAKFAVPDGAARKLLDTDPEILRLLVSRDARLPKFRDKLGQILEADPPKDEHDMHFVLKAFIDYAFAVSVHDTFPWRVVRNGTQYTFPGKDTYAMWVCLQDMMK